MNRRQFTKSLAALAAAPALPMSSFAAASTPAISAGSHPAYLAASVMARTQNQCSPAALARRFGLDQDTAQALFHALRVDGVLGLPNASGVAKAVKPFGSTLTSHSGALGTKAALHRDRITKVELRDSLHDPALEAENPIEVLEHGVEGLGEDEQDAPKQEKPAHMARALSLERN